MTVQSKHNQPKAHALSLRLQQGKVEGNAELQLNQPSFSGLNSVKIATSNTKRTAMLVCSGLDGARQSIDLLQALQSGLLELVKVGSQDVVCFSTLKPNPPAEPMAILPKPSLEYPQERAELVTNSTSQAWKTALQPGQTYELRLSKTGGEAWAYYTCPKRDGTAWDMVKGAHIFPVHRNTTNTVRFTVRDDPAPPKLFAKLLTPKVCHASGTPPFTLTVEFKTDSDKPITIDKSRTALSDFWLDFTSMQQLMSCKDVESGEKVWWPTACGCFDSDPRPDFPEDSNFVEIGPGQTWQFNYTMGQTTGALDDVLEYFEVGHTYTAQIAEYLQGFERWMYGRKVDLLEGDVEEKQRRWKRDAAKRGFLRLYVQSPPTQFSVVA